MTPKEKAQEFYNKFSNTAESWIYGKRCALLAVDKILEALYSLPLGNAINDEIEYYEQVKEEIKKI